MLNDRTLTRRPKRIGCWIGCAVVSAVIVLSVLYPPNRVARAAAGLAAHNICAAVFTTELSPDTGFRELVQPLAGGWSAFIRYNLDRSGRSVTASFAGLVHATARFTDGYGCRLEYPDNLPLPPPRAPARFSGSDAFAPLTVVATTDPAPPPPSIGSSQRIQKGQSKTSRLWS